MAVRAKPFSQTDIEARKDTKQVDRAKLAAVERITRIVAGVVDEFIEEIAGEIDRYLLIASAYERERPATVAEAMRRQIRAYEGTKRLPQRGVPPRCR